MKTTTSIKIVNQIIYFHQYTANTTTTTTTNNNNDNDNNKSNRSYGPLF